jgi:hypothetical protein
MESVRVAAKGGLKLEWHSPAEDPFVALPPRRFLGDYQAVKRGRVGKRIANKLIGRGVVRRLWR